jgi:hypothetical protein
MGELDMSDIEKLVNYQFTDLNTLVENSQHLDLLKYEEIKTLEELHEIMNSYKQNAVNKEKESD